MTRNAKSSRDRVPKKKSEVAKRCKTKQNKNIPHSKRENIGVCTKSGTHQNIQEIETALLFFFFFFVFPHPHKQVNNNDNKDKRERLW